jgi:predicted enzyme related to lactoylglutathione lyase
MSKHLIVHVELSTKDRVASADFYHELFDWEVQQIPEANYATFRTEDKQPGGGFNPITPENPAGTVMVYISTDDIKESLAKVEKLGGTVLFQPMTIPDVGLFACFKDPTGNTLALLEAHEDMHQ